MTAKEESCLAKRLERLYLTDTQKVTAKEESCLAKRLDRLYLTDTSTLQIHSYLTDTHHYLTDTHHYLTDTQLPYRYSLYLTDTLEPGMMLCEGYRFRT